LLTAKTDAAKCLKAYTTGSADDCATVTTADRALTKAAFTAYTTWLASADDLEKKRDVY
jgi:hypothetical protein